MLALAKKIGNKLRSFAARSYERGSLWAARAIFSSRYGKFMNKPVVIILFALAVAVFLIPKPAHAQGVFDIETIASNAIGYVCFEILYVVSYIAAAIIAVITYLISIFLALNTHVVDAFAVQMGSSVSLSIANLGFVLGIIVIAIATILHAQTYGIKQILWKLVVAAILVNFSLVIAGAILGVAGSFTTYFMSALPSGTPGNNSSYSGFADALAGAFQPHTLVLNFDTNATNKSPTGEDVSGAAAVSGSIGALLQPILNLFFVAGFLIVIVITLVVFLFMLIIRYLYLGILLILMPFAWLMWIFPKFQHLWSKWWSMFFKWTFFAPIVMFFLYLAIMTASVMSESTVAKPGTNPMNPLSQIGSLAANPSTGKALDKFMGGLFNTTLFTFLQMLMVIGLAVGGMIAANSLSITGAGVALGAMKSAGKWTQGYVGRQTAKAGRATFRAVGGEKAVEKMEKGELGAAGRIPGVRRLAGIAGRALRPVMTNEAMVEQAAKKVPEDKETWEKEVSGSMNTQTMMGFLQKGEKNDWIKPGMKVNGKEITKILQEDSAKFRNYGQSGEGKLEEKLRDSTGLTAHDKGEENKKLRARNEELDKKRKMSPEEIRQKAGLSDDDVKLLADAENPNNFMAMSAKEKERLYNLQEKIKEAKRGGGGGLKPEEQGEYDDNKIKIEENEKRIKKTPPEALANAFQDAEMARAKLAREGKEIPVTLKPEFLANLQTTILRSFAEGFSPYNARALLDAIAKKNNMKYFEAAMLDLKSSKKPEDAALFAETRKSLEANAELKHWMQANAGRALYGNLRQLFGLKPTVGEKKRMEGKEIEEEEMETGEET